MGRNSSLVCYLVFSLLIILSSAGLQAESNIKTFTIVYTNNTMDRLEPCRH